MIFLPPGAFCFNSALIRHPAPRRRNREPLAVCAAHVLAILKNDRSARDLRLRRDNPERGTRLKINNTRPGKAFYSLVARHRCGEGGSDFASRVTGEQVTFTEFVLDFTDVVTGKNWGNQK